MEYISHGGQPPVRRTVLGSVQILGASVGICSLNINFQSLRKLQKHSAIVVRVKDSNSFQEGLKK